jgi:hypothetical protein
MVNTFCFLNLCPHAVSVSAQSIKSEPKKMDLYVCVYVCVCVCTYVYIYIVCVCVHIYICVFVYVCVYIYICTYTHTHTHTHTHTIPIHFEAVNVVMDDSRGLHVLHLHAILKSQYPSIFTIQNHYREYI